MSRRKPKVEVRHRIDDRWMWIVYRDDGLHDPSLRIFDTQEEAIADFEKLINAVAEIARDQGMYEE